MAEYYYPGFEQVIKEAEYMLTEWGVCGYQDKVYFDGDWYDREEQRYFLNVPHKKLDGSFDSVWIYFTFDREQGFFAKKSPRIEKERFEAYFAGSGLTLLISKGKFPSISIYGTREAMLNSPLNRKLRVVRSRVMKILPLAQKFYEHEIVRKYEAHRKDPEYKYHTCGKMTVTKSGVHFSEYHDKDGYTYPTLPGYSLNGQGYRNLEGDDELLAFVLAIQALLWWEIEPKDINPEYLFWNTEVDNLEEIDHLPVYREPEQNENATYKEPVYKDFFE